MSDHYREDEITRDEYRELLEAKAERDRLFAAIKKHHDQKADDRCWMDDSELYAAAGLPPADVRVGDQQAMLQNCKRFVARRCEPGGPWKSYAELEAENEDLRAKLVVAFARIAGQSQLLSRTAERAGQLPLTGYPVNGGENSEGIR